MISMILYVIVIIYMMIEEIQSFIRLKWKYFIRFWSLIHFGIIICSWGNIAVYIWRFRESNRIEELFAQTNGYFYINIGHAVYINDILTYFQSFCCFFGMIQFLHLCRINSRLSLFIETLSNARRELQSFAAMFTLAFMSFVFLFYLLFVSKMWSCANLLSTAQMLFEVTLMKINTNELLSADAVLGPVCLTLFIFVIVFICLSMFLSIITENFRRVRDQRHEKEEMLTFMWKNFVRWTGRE